jgi:hypothetical protein
VSLLLYRRDRSMLFTGSFDHQIMIFDLDAHINKPLFMLDGHSSAVMRIVAMGNCDRCLSLDDGGNICFWDISKFSAADSTERMIDTTKFSEDHYRCFDVMVRGNGMFKTMHGLIVTVYGSMQHVLRIQDTCPKESAPLGEFMCCHDAV